MLGASLDVIHRGLPEAPPRCGDHTAHLPPGALLTCWICFPCLVHQKRAAATEHLAEGADAAGALWGLRRAWTPGPVTITPSATPSPLCHVATCASCSQDSSKQASLVAFRRLSDSCVVTSPPFHPCLPTC